MNISRIALLSALISAPIFAMEPQSTPEATETAEVKATPETTETSDVKATSEVTETADIKATSAEKASMIAAVAAFASARKNNGLDFLDFFANHSCNLLFNKLATFECLKGESFKGYITPAGRIIVSAAFLTAFYTAYNAYNAQDVDTDEDIFGDEEYADLN